ncbi:MAG: hypothetical protein Q9217_000697 [Psora testacea]
MTYALHEPFPTYHSSIGFGRGGAGNRTTKITKPNIPPPPPYSSTTSTSLSTADAALHSIHKTNHGQPAFSTGRGGAGNMHAAEEERAIFHFDEELERERRRGSVAPVYHVGRGGQGNLVVQGHGSDDNERSRRGTMRSGSLSSASSGGSAQAEGKRGSLDWVKGLARKA